MVTYKRTAKIAISSLDSVDRRKVEHVIGLLEKYAEDPSMDLRVQKLKGAHDNQANLFMIRANSELRILFQHSGRKIKILEILPISRVKRMHAQAV